MAATLTLIDQSRKSTDIQIRAHAREVAGQPRGKGTIIPAVIKTLLDALGDEDLAAVVTVYRDAMQATRRFWKDEGKDAKSGRAKGRWVIEPDHKTRISAANMVAAYMEGLPIQRQIALRGEFHELGDLIKEMRHSGEAARLMPAAIVHSSPSKTKGGE